MLYDMVADRSEYFRAYYKAHKAEYAARGRVWRVANPERMREHCRKANLKRHDKIVAYRLATVEKRCAWQREYEATRRDPEKRREHVWKWQAKHGAAYLAELDFKYNTRKATDGARTVGGIQRMVGKRLMLRRPKLERPSI